MLLRSGGLLGWTLQVETELLGGRKQFLPSNSISNGNRYLQRQPNRYLQRQASINELSTTIHCSGAAWPSVDNGRASAGDGVTPARSRSYTWPAVRNEAAACTKLLAVRETCPESRVCRDYREEYNPAEMSSSAYCLVCNEGIKYVPGGNAVVEHMKGKHRDLLASFITPSPRKKKRSKRRKSSDGTQSGKPKRLLTSDENDKIKRALAKWIARRMRPMAIVEDEELQELCDLFGELGGFCVDLPGRTQIREAINSDADDLRDNLRKELAIHSGFYCVTTDIWTDRSTRSYMSLTIHYVDDAFQSHNKLLGVAHFPGKHGGGRIATKLIQLLDDWGLDKDKCAMLIRDGASNAVSGANSSGLRHMSCIAHSLQLVLAGALMRIRKKNKTPKTKAQWKNGRKKAVSSPTKTTTIFTDTSDSEGATADATIAEDDEGDGEYVEESETDNDDDVADNAVDYQAIQQVRDAARKVVDSHIGMKSL